MGSGTTVPHDPTFGSLSPMITIEDFFQTELKVAKVTAAEAIPNSHKLIKLSVDLGDETRVLVAGIAKEYSADQLLGRQVVVVTNLQPAKLMGVESQGMVLAASVDGRPVLLAPDETVPAGTPVR
jgi:methionine--tRNA ligase beta chain